MNKKYTIIEILTIIGLIVVISGCIDSGTNVTKNNALQNFQNQYMAFQYPQGWESTQYDSGYGVALSGIDGQINVNLEANKAQFNSYMDAIKTSDEYLGKFKVNNMSYVAYYDAQTNSNEYGFVKNNKYFNINGPAPQNQTMLTIIQTIN